MSEAFDDYRNLVADRDQLLEHNAELRARVAELEQERDESDDQLRRRIQLLRTDNADLCAALAKREAAPVKESLTTALRTSEWHFAMRDAHEAGDSDAYFKARPQEDSGNNRHIFREGFVRGFDAGEEVYASKREAVAVPECFLALYRAALGLTHGEDWNNGTAASFHRIPLIDATGRCAELLAASQQAAKPEPIPEENVIVWLADDPEAGPFYSRHDALIAWTEENFYEGDNLVGLELRVQIATPMPDEILTITAVDEDGLITDFTEKQAAKGEGT